MNVMALDLELNQPSGTIIQVGIVIGNIEHGTILEKKNWLIYTDEKINPFITELTTIKQEMVDNGVLLPDAYREMVALYKRHNCTLNFVTWGGGDHKELKKQLFHQCTDLGVMDLDWEFGFREFDVKTLFLAFALASGGRVKSGLAKALTRVGMAFRGTKHWAPDDAENTFLLLIHLLRRMPKDVLIK